MLRGDILNTSENVKVSVCIPTYNSALYIRAAIDSVLIQEFKDYEILIVDDCSSDDTKMIIEKYTKKYPQIRFYINKKNLGIVGNFNKCLDLSSGEYIKFLLADDLFLDRKSLGKYVEVLELYPNVSLVASARELIDENSNLIKNSIKFEEGLYKPGKNIIKDCLLRLENKIGEPTSVIFRKMQGERGFDSRYKQILDLEMWFHLLKMGSFYYIEKPLVAFRVHKEQASNKNKKNLSYIDDYIILIKDYATKTYIGYIPFIKKILLYKYFYHLRRLKKRKIIPEEFLNQSIDREFNRFSYYLLLLVFKFAKNILRIQYLRK